MGDVVIATDGSKIRSVYQALSLVIRKLPGDKVSMQVRRGEAEQVTDVDITLGGGGNIAPAQLTINPSVKINQGVHILVLDSNNVPRVMGRSVGGAVAAIGGVPRSGQENGTRDSGALVDEQLKRWALAIQHLNAELKRRDEEQRRNAQRVLELQRELDQLREQLKRQQPQQATPSNR